MTSILYRPLTPPELTRELFSTFERLQIVTDCWRKIDGAWVIRSAPFIDQWREADYHELIHCLKRTLQTGGTVFGAFIASELKGFTSVEGKPLGTEGNYIDLSCLHVSNELRGHGIGRQLFTLAADWARAHGGEKLYISAHSAVETQAFYHAMGCVDTVEPNPKHVAAEPYDRQLEYVL